jgi:hypothetical protein
VDSLAHRRREKVKRLTKEGWRALRVFNSRGLCVRGGKGVFVAYVGPDCGRGGHGAYWQVIKPGFKTDPDGPWYCHGHKTFSLWKREEKEAKRLEAIAWASFVFKVEGEWERDPWGDYHPAGTLEAAALSVTA